MADRTWGSASANSIRKTGFNEVQNTTTSGFIPSVQNSSSSQNAQQGSESFTGISNPEALASLLEFIRTGMTGNKEYQAQVAKRRAVTGDVEGLLGTFSRDMAFRDSELMMQQNLQKSLESQMPAIMNAIQGAGTSASSMQGLLSQKLATESAQAAGALGAQQATAYGNISSNLANTLEALTRVDDKGTDNFLKALELLKVSTSSSYGNSSGQSQSSAVGATPANQTTSTKSVTPADSSASSSSSSAGTAASGYQYIPYDLQNPGLVNPFSNEANQLAASNFYGYNWD